MRHKALNILALTLFFAVMMTATIETIFAVTWSVNITRLTTVSDFEGLPAITETSDGRVWIVWARDILGNLTLFYKTSSDLGFTWSKEQNLTQELGPGQNTSPSIMQATNGTIWIVWSSNKPPPPPPPEPDFTMDADPQNLTIEKGHSANSTIIVTSLLNFSEPVDLSIKNVILGVSTTLDPTQVTPPPNGTANSTLTISVDTTADPGNYTLTVRGTSENKSHSVNIFLEITGVGGSTSSSTALTSKPSRVERDVLKLVKDFQKVDESSSTDSSSESDDYEIFYKTSHDNGMTWSNDIQLTNNTENDRDPSIVQLSNGTILVAWQWERAGNTDIYYKTTLDGAIWSDAKQLTTDTGLDRSPSVTQAMDGKIWVTWASNRTGDFEIFYKTYNGSSWTDDTRLTVSTYMDVTPSIYQTVDEIIWIFWSSSDVSPTATADIYYKCSSNNGISWSDPVQFTTDTYEDSWPSVYQTRDTKIWVVWTSNRGDQPDGNWDIYYRTSLAGDVNQDGIVDEEDLSRVSSSYGYFEGEPGYDPDADLTKDGFVDIVDYSIVVFYLGST